MTASPAGEPPGLGGAGRRVIGRPFACAELAVAEALTDAGRYVVAVNDPPWGQVEARVPAPITVVTAASMELAHLETLLPALDGADLVVGLGGGTALDTAKFLAWRSDRPLVQIPSITSVDAGFTDAVGVRVEGRVRYVGRVEPRLVVVDVELIRSAPRRLNRAGIGDILSCHTGLHDWARAAAAGHAPAWDDDLAALGRELLDELADAVDEVRAVTPSGVLFLADAYRRIGAACAHAGHSRFEEGSEHFFAYAWEHATGQHHVHGELVACGVVALAAVQANEPDRAAALVAASGCRAHPDDLGIDRERFATVLLGLRDYCRADELDVSIVDLSDIGPRHVDEAWDAITALPRRPGDGDRDDDGDGDGGDLGG